MKIINDSVIQAQQDWIVKNCNVRANMISYNETTQLFDIGCQVSIDHSFMGFEAPIGTVYGDLNIHHALSSTLKNFPNTVMRDFRIKAPNLLSLEGIPSVNREIQVVDGFKLQDIKSIITYISGDVTKVTIPAAKIISFLGIDTTVNKNCRSIDRVSFDVHHDCVGGIGLILLPKIKSIGTWAISDKTAWAAFTIIKKYFGRPEDIFECQMELIDAGYARFAQL